jgi:predicted RNase H-like HicB family nuclease
MNTRNEIAVCWSAGDSCFLVEMPELPSLTRDGASRQEALRNAEEVLDAYLETARHESWPVSEPRGRLAFA